MSVITQKVATLVTNVIQGRLFWILKQISIFMEKSNKMKDYIDISLVCRICLQASDEEMISMYEKDADEPFCIYEKIEKCANIKISDKSEMPMRICGKCKVFLSFAFKFYMMCQNSQSYLDKFGLQDSDMESEFSETEYLLEPNEDGYIKDVDVKDNEYWIEDDDMHEIYNNSDQIITTDTKTYTSKKRKQTGAANSPVKTLDISLDGAAVIRYNNEKGMEKEFKRNQSHICDICGNRFTKNYALVAHMRRHRDEKPFECEICPRKFNYNFQLRRHIIQHSGARPYKCSYCQRSFTDRSTMKKHERIHRNERPFQCDVCQKTFTYSSVLKVHKQTHTGEKPYNCGICGKRFSRAHHLRAHLETQLHSKDPQAKILLKQMRPDEENSEEVY